MKGFVIHINEKSESKAHRGSENYYLRRNILINETIPTLKKIGITIKCHDAILYENLKYNRLNEHLFFNPNAELNFKRKKYKLDNPHPIGFEIALLLGHYQLWNKCIKLNESILILEDDVIIDNFGLYNIHNAIIDFNIIDEPALLYLQSTTPSTEKPKRTLKNYSSDILFNYSQYLFKVSNNHYDWSGTAAYVINPKGAEKLIEKVNDTGIMTPDGFIHRAFQERKLNPYIPKDYRNNFLLHPDLS